MKKCLEHLQYQHKAEFLQLIFSEKLIKHKYPIFQTSVNPFVVTFSLRELRQTDGGTNPNPISPTIFFLLLILVK